MSSRIIVKNLPKKITEKAFKTHFSKIGEITDAKLKFTNKGQFRRFGFIGYKTDEQAKQAIEYFNNSFINATKIIVEECKSLNDANLPRPWSKYSVGSSSYKKLNEKSKPKEEKKDETTKKSSAKLKKIEELLGPLKDDEQFKEFLEANKAINSKESIWKDDIVFKTNNDADDEKIKKKKDKKSKDTKKEITTEETNEEPNKKEDTTENKGTNDNEDVDFENGRLFIRNLSYSCKEEDLESLFSKYKPLVEVNMPIDSFSKKPKGFAYITFMFPEHALKAFSEFDGTIFQGRMLHIIPAKGKIEDENQNDKNGKDLTLKEKRELEKKKNAQKSYNWNSLFINQNAIASLMATKYNVDKSELFDVQSNKKSVAVRLAVGETQIVNDIRKFLIQNGVKLDSFENSERSKTIILVKNLPFNSNENEIKELFSKYGLITRVVIPEYGVAALIEFKERQEARNAFKKLAYKKFKNFPLYLEWAPVDIFDGDKNFDENLEVKNEETSKQIEQNKKTIKENEVNGADATDNNDDDDNTIPEPNSTLFVKNLSFSTNESKLIEIFKKIGKCKATIARKLSPKKELLSMGYGFIEFKTHSNALEALKKYQNHEIDGHKIELKLSTKQINKIANITDDRKRKINQKANVQNNSTKILVRNIPFEAKAKEVEELFKVFGELKYVRLPKKIDGTHRGFGFVEFLTKNDAKRAFDALCHSTHLFGRRLVLEWSEMEQTQDVEVLRIKEAQLSGPSSKRLKKSKIMHDLGENVEQNDEKIDIDEEFDDILEE